MDGANQEVQLDVVNVHLFHDVCNLVAQERSPSVYSQYRANGLRYTLNRCRDAAADRPFFVFGDFNFRLDSHALLEQLCKMHQLTVESVTASPSHDASAKRLTSLRFRRPGNDDAKPCLELAEKRFKLLDGDGLLRDSADGQPGSAESNVNVALLRPFDCELRSFSDVLCEMPVRFAPTYPLSEKAEEPGTYMPTRCPSWCDRVLVSHTVSDLLSQSDPAQYDVIGRSVCTGDHKPVFLYACLSPSLAP